MTPRRGRQRAAMTADERRARILDAALSELVARGFEAASTNAIAAAAGVAKGLVFHYFGSKEALFVAVYREVLGRTMAAMAIDWATAPNDLFERLHLVSARKLRAFADDPRSFQFFAVAGAEAPPSVAAEIARIQADVAAGVLPGMLAGVDTSRLRPGVTLAQAVETLFALAEGLEKRILSRLATLPDRGASQLDAVTAEVWAHFERLRDGLYVSTPSAPG